MENLTQPNRPDLISTVEVTEDVELGLVPAWSYSALKTFETCAYRTYIAKVKRVKEDYGPAAERGTRIHDEAERFVRHELGDEVPDSLRKFSQNFLELKQLFADGKVQTEGEWGFTLSWEPTGWISPDTWAACCSCDASSCKNQQNFSEKKDEELSQKDDLIIFDYVAKVDGKDFEGNTGKNIQLVLGKDLFIKGFDQQLIGVKINQNKSVTVKLPENYPKKDLANKKADFDCKILKIKKPIETKINDEFGKKLGAKDLNDLKDLIKKQIKSQYQNTLETITKRKILEQIDKDYDIDLPQNLIDQELKLLNQNLKKEELEKSKNENYKIAKTRIKTGLILNEIGIKNNLKVNESEIQGEIQKQMRSMPGQEKMVLDYYKNNQSALASLRGAIYEEKVVELIKTKIKLDKKNINTKEAEEVLKKINEKPKKSKTANTKKDQKKQKSSKKNK